MCQPSDTSEMYRNLPKANFNCARTDEQVYKEAVKRKDQYGAFHVAITPFMVYNTRYDKKGENNAMDNHTSLNTTADASHHGSEVHQR